MIEQELQERIDALLDDDTQPDWSDVVARATEPVVPRRRRRLPAVLALAAAIAAAVALLPGRIGSRHAHVDVVAQALAAVSQGPVLHAVLEVPTSETWSVGVAHAQPTIEVLDLANGSTQPVVSQMELWYDAQRGLALQVDSVNGTVTWQSLQTPNGDYDDRGHEDASSGPAQIDPGLAGFLKGYRQALADGSATDAGAGTFDGRAVEWLRFPAQTSDGAPEEVAVDPSTFQAVALRAICQSCTVAPPTYSITTLEGVARDAVDFSPPKPVDAHPVKCYCGDRYAGTLSRAATFLGRRTYWAGRSVDRLAFSGTLFDTPTNYSTDIPSVGAAIASGKGVTFFYGAPKPPNFDANPGDPYLSIGETADVGFGFAGFNMEELSGDGQPLTLARTVVPPAGQAILTDIGGWWVAQLREADLYVEIQAQSRALAVDAARMLSPTP